MEYKEYSKSIPKEFRSDGCTYAPDLNIRECCRIHDYAINDKSLTRLQADRMFRSCVKDKSNPFIAFIYYYAVRLEAIMGFPLLISLLALVSLASFFYYIKA